MICGRQLLPLVHLFFFFKEAISVHTAYIHQEGKCFREEMEKSSCLRKALKINREYVLPFIVS